MSRLATMSRFFEPDEPKKMATCESCYEALYEGDTALKYDGCYFCDDECFFESMPEVKVITLGDE